MNERDKEIIASIVKILVGRLHVSRVILFGSRSKNTNSPTADYDIAVDSPVPDTKTQRDIRDEIEKVSGLHQVDIVYLDAVDDAFKNIVLKTGEVIHERRN